MTSASSISQQPDPPGRANNSHKRSWTIDAGLAVIIAALIGLVPATVTFFVGRSTVSGTKSNSSTSKGAHGAASATITPPATGKVPFVSALSGRVANLQRGELVWTLFQVVNRNGSFGSQTFPTSGPCNVDFSSDTWTCRDAYIGKVSDNKTYRVCVVVLSFSEAYDVVKLIENTYAKNLKLYPYWFAAPPSFIHDNNASCMSVQRIN